MSTKRLIVLIVIGLVGGAIAVGLYWQTRLASRWQWINRKPEQSEPSRAASLQGVRNPGSDFDLQFDLPGDPLGVAGKEGDLLIGNRIDPWGFLRLTRLGASQYQVQKILVTDPYYDQKVGFTTVTWNGDNFIAYTEGSWFRASTKNVFTVHDPATLRVVKHYPAPELIGGLAWDGNGYWAATRRNTEDSREPAFLYRFNQQFEEIDRMEPPGIGCQGLAWDGSYLWFVDVFSDTIYKLDAGTRPARVIHTYNTRFQYLSGVAFDGQTLWITEYDGKKLRRMNAKMMAAWEDTTLPVDITNSVADLLAEPKAEEPEEPPEYQVSAQAKSSDRYRAMATAPYPNDEATVIDFSVELRDDSLYGSWNLYYGEDFFADNSAGEEGGMISMPTLAKYRITVRGGSLDDPVEREYDAVAGENEMQDELMTDELGPGRYSVGLFIHVQYVDSEGTNRILNDSIPSLEIVIPE